MITETIDKLYLELSQVTTAKTAKELALQEFADAAAVLFDVHGPVTGSAEWQAAWAKAAEAHKGIR